MGEALLGRAGLDEWLRPIKGARLIPTQRDVQPRSDGVLPRPASFALPHALLVCSMFESSSLAMSARFLSFV